MTPHPPNVKPPVFHIPGGLSPAGASTPAGFPVPAATRAEWAAYFDVSKATLTRWGLPRGRVIASAAVLACLLHRQLTDADREVLASLPLCVRGSGGRNASS